MTEECRARIKTMIDEIVDWLEDFKQSTGQKGFVLGLSGGIDSAVVAHLIMRACPENSLGVIMPAGNLPIDAEYGVLSAKSAGLPYITIDLTAQRHDLTAMVDDALSNQGLSMGDKRMVQGNLGARLRMSVLYAVGNSLNYLVTGTDNMAEAYTGYFTKYGDGGVDILPISHLTKGEVYALGEYLGVPKEIISRPPTAGFFHSQTDEQEMGVDYKTIDAYLRGEEIPAEKRLIIEDLHKKSQHKRMLPPGVRSCRHK